MVQRAYVLALTLIPLPIITAAFTRNVRKDFGALTKYVALRYINEERAEESTTRDGQETKAYIHPHLRDCLEVKWLSNVQNRLGE